ncbi:MULTISPECIES: hypothetical protein [Proteus]|uniref:hypothetical protein n=1 Tax=Proteus TaxID=583 RepID=UPI000C1ED4A7|nr:MULTISPECIES: hypothetical protein [Proteus]MBI6250780.1 hypothetical protein [Proteus mirabilis]MBI6289092.1 hypothetical protein [Proteus mirabilis]MDC5886451.1 hypothetical protein [Proteus mirabilis]MDC5893581.1 hypothetical protein [Proteus mirabilis]MDC5904048.1 hypothetical protein [Proteus mirabilis]
MDEEIAKEIAKQVTNAILSLKSESNYVKDYLVPILTPFLSAILGYLVARFSFGRSEKIKQTALNIENGNKIFLKVADIQDSLVAVKLNYYNKINDDPHNRIIGYHYIVSNMEMIKVDISTISFLINRFDPSDEAKSWYNIRRINMLFDNYNAFVMLFNEKNELSNEFQNRINSNKGNGKITSEEIWKYGGNDLIPKLISLNEKAIYFLDDLLKESIDFLESYEKIVKSSVDYKLVYKQARIFGYVSPDKEQKIYKRVIDVNYSALAEISGIDEEFWRKELDFGYER